MTMQEQSNPTGAAALVAAPAGNDLHAMIDIPSLALTLQPTHLLDMTKYGADQMSIINQKVSSVSFDDTNSLTTFGAASQRKLSQYLDELLTDMRTREAGSAGQITIALATTIKGLNLQQAQKEASGQGSLAQTLGKLPLIGGWFSAIRAMQMNHKKITEHLTAIEQQANADITALAAITNKLDRMVDASIEHIRDIELDMAAGQILVKRGRVDFERRRAEVSQSRDVVEIAKLRDFAERLNAFETRIVRIHLAHSQSIVAIPEIRTSQTASVIEMSSVMNSILFDLPALKRAILKIAALTRITQASKDTKARHEVTQQLGELGSELLQATYLQAKESQGDFAADVAALSQSADKLLQTIELGRRLDIANVEKRQKAIDDLSKINNKFTDGLLRSGDQFIQNISQS